MELSFFPASIACALGWMVVHSLWQATLIAVLAGAALILLHRKTAKFRYLFANMALVAMLAAAIVTFGSYYQTARQPAKVVFLPDEKAEKTAIFSDQKIADVTAFENTYFDKNTVSWAGLSDYLNRNIYFIVLVWAMGAVLFMFRLLGGISYIYYLKNRLNFPADEFWQDMLDGLRRRAAVQKSVELVESALVRSPLVVGYLKPMILFPLGAINRLQAAEVEAILAHELAHVLRHDYVFNMLQSLVEALFYYHPAVWWLSAQVRTERENCCDDLAIELCGNSLTYAKSLVSIQEMAYFAPQMAMAFAGNNKKNQLLLRVQRILQSPQNRTNIMEKLVSTCLLLGVMVFLSFAGNHFDKKNIITKNNRNADENKENRDEKFKKTYFILFLDESGNLDSLPLTANAKDGNYNFDDQLQKVRLVVKDRQVVKFNINGLEVAPVDIPKFEALINHIVDAPAPPETTMPSYADFSDFSDFTQQLWSKYELFKNNNMDAAAQQDREQAERDAEQAQRDMEQAERDEEQAGQDEEMQQAIAAELRKDGLMRKKTTYFSLCSRNMMVNERVFTGEMLKKYIKIYERASRQRFGTDSVVAITFGDQQNSVHESHSDFEGVSKTDKKGMYFTPPVPPSPPSVESVPMPPSPPNGYQNFFSQLVKDGYLKLNQKTRIGANEKGIKVDGKTLDERTFTKYKKIIEQCSGKKLDKNF